MKIKLTILTLLALAPALFSADLGTLKSQYEAAIRNATAPINTKYESELRKMLFALPKDAPAAAEINAELARLTGKAAEPVLSEEDEKVKRAFSGAELLIIGGAKLTFKRDMTGTKTGGAVGAFEVPFTWRVEDGMVVSKGAQLPGGPDVVVYYKLEGKSMVRLGTNKTALTATATLNK
jgi:hypothetical protein